MKNKTLFTVTMLLIMSFIFTGCRDVSVTETPAGEEVTANVTIAASNTPQPTVTPVPTGTAIPTPIPTPTELPPIPCIITFDSDRDSDLEIYRMDPNGKNQVNLTNNPADDWDPVWSPDGAEIAFVSNRENGQESGQFIYVMNADGSDARQLNTESASNQPDWSHDGSTITYTNNDDIYIMRSDGSGQAANLTNSPEKDSRPTWSPDGQKIAWLTGTDNHWDIFVMDANGADVRQLTNDGKVIGVSWTVDGKLFALWDNPEAGCFNCVMDEDGSNIINAGGKTELQRYLPFWTEDGGRVELANGTLGSNDEEIFLVGEIFPDLIFNLTNNPANDRNPDWPANCGPNANISVQSDAPAETSPSQTTDQGIVIGYEDSANSMTDQRKKDLQTACDELKIQCVKGESIAKLAEQNVSAILSFSNRWQVMGSYSEINEVVKKGIPLFILNAETGEPGAYNLSVESETVRASLNWMFKQMGEKGKFVYFNFGPSDFHEALINEVLGEYPGIQATAMPADYNGNSFTEESIAALVAENLDLGAIWTNEKENDVFWGLKDFQGKESPLIVCPSRIDILQSWKDRLDAGSKFKCISFIKPGGTAYEGVYAAYFILNGSQINPEALGGTSGNTFIYDFPEITNDNLAEWLMKVDSFRVSEGGGLELPPMSPEEIKAKWFIK